MKKIHTVKNACFTILTLITQLAVSAYGADSQASTTQRWQFKTDDTHLTLAVIDNRQVIVELRNPVNGWNWTPKPTEVPLLNRVLLATTDTHNVDWNRYPKWVFQDAVMDTSDGYMVTLRFVSSSQGLWPSRALVHGGESSRSFAQFQLLGYYFRKPDGDRRQAG